MRLRHGMQAPPFEMEDAEGKTVSLEAYRGKKTLLCFFRYAGCPFCNLAFFRLLDRYPSYAEKGLRMLAFFQSTAASVRKYIIKRHNPAFPVIPDPKKEVYDAYGIESSVAATVRTAAHMDDFFRAWQKGYPQPGIDGDFFLVPASFLIGPRDLTIHAAHYGKHFSDSYDFAEIETFLGK